MIRSVKILLIALVISLFFAGQVRACPSGGHGGTPGHGCPAEYGCITIIDVYDYDQNKITERLYYDDARFGVKEDYGEQYLIPYPYPSHDGYAIVNSQKQYFDKIVSFEDGDLTKCCCGNSGCTYQEGIWAFEFQVHNTSPYAWSDYHFEFWDETFTNRYQNPALLLTDGWDSNIFQNSSFDGSILQFWAPNWQYPSQTNTFLLYMNLNKFACGCGCTCTCGNNPCTCDTYRAFGIRQVATTVPEPATMVLVGSGLLGAATFRKLRKK
jgi:hypothetical protein